MKLQAKTRLQASTEIVSAYTGTRMTQLVEYANRLCPDTLKFSKTYKVPSLRYAYKVTPETLKTVEHKLKADGWEAKEQPRRTYSRIVDYTTGNATITISTASDSYSVICIHQATR